MDGNIHIGSRVSTLTTNGKFRDTLSANGRFTALFVKAAHTVLLRDLHFLKRNLTLDRRIFFRFNAFTAYFRKLRALRFKLRINFRALRFTNTTFRLIFRHFKGANLLHGLLRRTARVSSYGFIYDLYQHSRYRAGAYHWWPLFRGGLLAVPFTPTNAILYITEQPRTKSPGIVTALPLRSFIGGGCRILPVLG